MVSRIAFPAPVHGLTGRFDLSKVWHDIVDGVRFLREDSIASAMTGGIVVAFAAVGAVLALGPIFVAGLDRNQAAWGVVVTAFGVGMFLGMATASQVNKFVERDIAFVWALLAAAATLFVLAAMPSLALTAVVSVWLGAFCGLAWVSGYTLLQENVEDEFRGRTFASLTTLSRLACSCASPSSLSCRASMTDHSRSTARSTTHRALASPCGPPARSPRPPASTREGCSSGIASPDPSPSRSCRS